MEDTKLTSCDFSLPLTVILSQGKLGKCPYTVSRILSKILTVIFLVTLFLYVKTSKAGGVSQW